MQFSSLESFYIVFEKFLSGGLPHKFCKIFYDFKRLKFLSFQNITCDITLRLIGSWQKMLSVSVKSIYYVWSFVTTKKFVVESFTNKRKIAKWSMFKYRDLLFLKKLIFAWRFPWLTFLKNFSCSKKLYRTYNLRFLLE